MVQSENNQQGNVSSLKKIVLLFVRLLVSGAILYYLVNFIELGKIQSAIKDADIIFIVFAILLLPLNLFIQFKKWGFVCSSILNNHNKKQIWFSLFYGISGGLVTPLQAGEYVTRAIPLQNVSIVKTAVATAIDKIFPLTIISFVGSVLSLPFLHYYFGISKFAVAVGFLAIILFFTLLYFVTFQHNDWAKGLLQKLSKVKFLKTIVSEMMEISQSNKKFSIKMSGFSILLILTYSFQFILIITAFTHHFDLLNYLWFVIIVLFTKTILPPITFGEIGIREAASVYFGSYFGIAEAAAFNAALILFIINLIIPSLIGLSLFTAKSK